MDISSFFTNILQWGIDILTLVMIGGVFWTILIAVITMAKNRQPRWDTIFFTLAILAIGIALVQIYPPMVVKGIRVGLQDARPEADLLRQELGNWMPEWNGAGDTEFSTAVPTVTPLPTWTPAPSILVEPTAVPATATPLPPTAIPTIDLNTWNPQTPPPTPAGGNQ